MAGRSRGATDSCFWDLGDEVLGLGQELFVLGFWAMVFCHRFFPRSPDSARAEVILRSAGQWGKPILGIINISVFIDYIEKLINSTADWYRMPSQRTQCKYCKKWVSRQHETLHIVWWECFQCMKTFNSPSGARYHKETIQHGINTFYDNCLKWSKDRNNLNIVTSHSGISFIVLSSLL